MQKEIHLLFPWLVKRAMYGVMVSATSKETGTETVQINVNVKRFHTPTYSVAADTSRWHCVPTPNSINLMGYL